MPAVLALLVLPCASLASPDTPPTEPPQAVSTPVETAPTLDGDVLDDPAWESAVPATHFWQTTPDEGAPASERTEVRVVYTVDTLYFGVVCFDRDPSGIIVTESRRDAPLNNTDSFQIILDTYFDRQNGFVFGTNPAGFEYDGQVRREGEGGDSTGGFNLNWDGAWEVRTQSGDFGWSAEFAIPFRTLRFARGAQVWGLNFQRNIRRRNETVFWAPLTRQYDLYRLSLAGTLVGIEPPSQRNLKLAPYALGEISRNLQADEASSGDGDVGLDAKYSLTPSLTLDLTVNTDFAQVEADEQQINLDRFNLFFPEKRPFFLENAGQFAVGSPEEVELFFSRRIGIGPAGEIVPILAGGRMSGKLAGTNVGLLNIQTRSVEGVTPANNFTVARVSRELPNRSAIGAIFVNRLGTGELSQPDDHNQTIGLDGRWGIGQYGQVAGYASRTFTPGTEEPQHAYNLSAEYNSPGWRLEGVYTDVGEGFNPEVGFLRRRGYRRPQATIFRTIRVKDFLGLLEVRPHASYSGFWKPDGFHESGFLHVDNHLEWRNGAEFHTGINFTREGLLESFEIYPGIVVPPGTYDHAEAQIVLRSNQGAPFSFDGRLVAGGFFGGDRVTVSPSVKARVGDTFQGELSWQRNDIDLPGGSFVTNLIRTRLSYSFTPRIYIQALLQYNDRIDNWSTNLRFGWLQTANTGLFVVYNENRDTATGGIGPRDRSLIIKYSRLFDLLN